MKRILIISATLLLCAWSAKAQETLTAEQKRQIELMDWTQAGGNPDESSTQPVRIKCKITSAMRSINNYFVVCGTIQNTGTNSLSHLKITGVAWDRNNQIIEEPLTYPLSTPLEPRQTVQFRLFFTDGRITKYDLKFEANI